MGAWHHPNFVEGVDVLDIGWILAEEKIKSAINKGDLDNLPGKGKPLQLEDLSGIPEELRASYKIMKNAGMLPEEMKIKKEMATLEELLLQCADETLKADYKRQLSEKSIRFQALMEKRKISSSSAFGNYQGKINKRIGL